MGARGLYTDYRFGARNVVSTVRDRREQKGVQQVPPEAPTVSLLDSPNLPDLRALLTPKKQDLRNSIMGKQQPAPPAKKKESRMVLVVPDPAFRGPTSRYGTDLFDIRERTKLDAAKKKEKEAEVALERERSARMEAEREEEAREADRKIRELTLYRDALVKDRESSSSKPSGSKGVVSRARKRTRSPTPPPRHPSSSPSPSRTPLSTCRQRETVRAGKGKGRRGSYSRSPSPRRHLREPRSSARTVPGL